MERAHQTLICMIGKLSRDKKLDWPKHLPELVHAYNSMRSAITGYSQHYLMYRCQPHLPVNFYYAMIRGKKKHQCVDYYTAKLCEWLWEAFEEAQVQSISEVENFSLDTIKTRCLGRENIFPYTRWSQISRIGESLCSSKNIFCFREN